MKIDPPPPRRPAGRPVTTGPTVRGVMIYLRPELHAEARSVLADGENLSRLISQLLTAEIDRRVRDRAREDLSAAIGLAGR